jgi:FtsZ-interacting cell division protein ZipA
MSTLGWIILAVVVVVVVVIGVLAMRAARARAMSRRAEQATGLRRDAVAHDSSIAQGRHQVTRAEAEAAVAKQRAEEAEQQAEAAREGLAHDEARREDLLREADRVDPSVDHRADDYRPTPPATSGGAHAGEPTDESGLGTASGEHRASA